MKKKILTILITILTACMLMFTLSACSGEPPHTHTFDKEVATSEYLSKEATCEDKAEYYYSCTCGIKGNETFESGDALGHLFINYLSNNDAKCEINGTESATCTRNNCTATNTREVLNSVLGHEFINYVSNNDATETEDGTETAECEREGCNKKDTRTDVGSALGVTEYISVQSLVDQVFAGIDFDANLKETINTLMTTRSNFYTIERILAFDFNVGSNDNVTFFAEVGATTSTIKLITKFNINTDTTKFENYLTLSKDFDGMITKMLEDENVTFQTQIIKDSAQHNIILGKLSDLKTKYFQEKTLLESTAKADIKTKNLLTTAQFDSAKMQELGITSMNDFAEALLNNTKGEGYDQVAGWTIDDVIATYIGEPTEENIEGKSYFAILLLLKDSILQVNVGTQRAYGDTTDRHSMLLKDDPNAWLSSENKVVEFSNNSIIYAENGERFN